MVRVTRKGKFLRSAPSDLRRSARTNFIASADGVSAGDEDMLQKAMRRAARRNLDGKTVGDSGSPRSPSNPSPLPPGMPNSLSRISFPSMSNDSCSRNLKTLGFTLGKHSDVVNLAVNALKNIEINRSSVAPTLKTQSAMPSSDTSDDDDTTTNGALLAHLVRDVSEVDFDEANLDLKICDLLASNRKSRNSSKKKGHKSRDGRHNNSKKGNR
jgi:hypothetical protein